MHYDHLISPQNYSRKQRQALTNPMSAPYERSVPNSHEGRQRSQRLSHLFSNSIQSIIQDLSAKRNLNSQALNCVRETNDVLAHFALSHQHGLKEQTTTTKRKIEEPDYAEVSKFTEYEDVNDFNFEKHNRLNSLIRSNNHLQQKCGELEIQNKALTNRNSTFFLNQQRELKNKFTKSDH